MKVKRTEQIWLKPNKEISRLCHLSKNVYNEANYIIRQEFINSGVFIGYNKLDVLLRDSENAKQLPSQVRQQILRLLEKDWISFFRLIKTQKKDKSKSLGRSKFPKYKKKDGEHLLIFTNQNRRIRDGWVTFPKKCNFGLEIKTRIKNEDLQQIKIIPKGYGYILEIVYNKEINPKELDKERVVGIDLGLRNVITMANNIGKKPIVVKGGVVKSINQYFNKKYAEIMHQLDTYEQKESRRLYKLINKRNRKIHDFFHKTSRFIINWCQKNNIGIIMIGHNKEFKQNINLGKRTNQNFVDIPFGKLIQQLQYKAEENGIAVILQDESHTSKCSFLDNESIKHHETYVGKRKSRGLFKSAKNIIINADVNGAYNIIKKAIPNAFARVEADGMEGVALHPVKYVNLTNEVM